MLRSTFLKRAALAFIASAFVDVPWPKPEAVPTFTRAGAVPVPFPHMPGRMTLYCDFIERAPAKGERVEIRKVIDYGDDSTLDLMTIGVPPTAGLISVKAAPGLHSMDEMRALAHGLRHHT